MPNLNHFYLFVLLLGYGHLTEAQELRFSLGAIAGMSLSQIDGDNLQGYDHLGLMAGLNSTAHITGRFSFSVELMYNQRGSKSNRLSVQNYLDSPLKVTTEYAEVNALFHLLDWQHEQEKYYRVDAYAGATIGRLIRTRISDPTVRPENFNNIAGEFNSTDIGFILGVAYKINRNWGWGIRFSRSLNKLFDAEKSRIASPVLRDWKAYFIALYTFYNF
ncbi:MAG: PorT family protein [Saprospiraceae bacterium]|nr:PorT family protein [Saprospiraceae bacterium]MCB9320856.1 PorT family protein [Lewinellaceae bacterium]